MTHMQNHQQQYHILYPANLEYLHWIFNELLCHRGHVSLILLERSLTIYVIMAYVQNSPR